MQFYKIEDQIDQTTKIKTKLNIFYENKDQMYI